MRVSLKPKVHPNYRLSGPSPTEPSEKQSFSGRGFCLPAAEADAEQHLEDATGCLGRGSEVAGDLAGTTEAAAVADRDLTNAQTVKGGFDLHLEVPAVGELRHMELLEGAAADGAEGSHVGVADALNEP